jgi:hypothetical protein
MGWWPGWDNADSATFWSHFWFWFGIACLFALGGAEVVSHFYSLRKEELIEAAQSSATEQAKQDQDNLRIQLTDAETQRRTEVDGLKNQLSDAEKMVSSLQAQQIPRRLSPEQRIELIAALALFPGQKVSIWCLTSASESKDFATEFISVFEQAKWQGQNSITFGLVAGIDPVGVEVALNTQEATPNTAAVALVATLVRQGFMSGSNIARDPNTQPGVIALRIGAKPR